MKQAGSLSVTRALPQCPFTHEAVSGQRRQFKETGCSPSLKDQSAFRGQECQRIGSKTECLANLVKSSNAQKSTSRL